MSSANVIYDRLLAAVALDGDDRASASRRRSSRPAGRGAGSCRRPTPVVTSSPSASSMTSGTRDRAARLLSVAGQQDRGGATGRPRRGPFTLPLFEMSVDAAPWSIRLTSLDFPHR